MCRCCCYYCINEHPEKKRIIEDDRERNSFARLAWKTSNQTFSNIFLPNFKIIIIEAKHYFLTAEGMGNLNSIHDNVNNSERMQKREQIFYTISFFSFSAAILIPYLYNVIFLLFLHTFGQNRHTNIYGSRINWWKNQKKQERIQIILKTDTIDYAYHDDDGCPKCQIGVLIVIIM